MRAIIRHSCWQRWALATLIFSVTILAYGEERSEAFLVQMYSNRVKVLSPAKFYSPLNILIENKTLVKIIGKVSIYPSKKEHFLTIEPKKQLTLVSIEALDEFLTALEPELSHGDFRRNIVTSGVDLNALVGREFEVDGVRCRGIETCEPCAHLAQTVSPLVLPHLIHKAGLRAEVLTSGEVKIGGVITSNLELQ